MKLDIYRLVWEAPNGELVQRRFQTFEELETFSKRLINAGLVPWVPPDVPCPYDNG